jgi:hypothetical protein
MTETPSTSLAWWNSKIAKHLKKGVMPEDYIKMERRSIQTGSMIIFKYDAKFKDQLAFWDKQPVIIIFNDLPGYFLGLNLHYIAPLFRQTLLAKIIEINKLKIRNDRRFDLEYEQLKEFIRRNGLEISIRKYIKGRMKSVDYVKGTEWKYVSTLPSERFVFNGEFTADQLYQMIRSHTAKTKAAKNRRYGR